MVRYRRNFVPGGTFFFTVTLANRRSSLLMDQVAALRAAFRAGRRERPFTIDAIVILPDHLHTILTLPPGDADFSGRWRRIKGHFSSHMIASGEFSKRHPNKDFALWQRRFWEHNEHDFARRIDYIHFNPVKHELVTRVRDWPHSSFPHVASLMRATASLRAADRLSWIRCSPRSDIRGLVPERVSASPGRGGAAAARPRARGRPPANRRSSISALRAGSACR
jgi:putative transposase